MLRCWGDDKGTKMTRAEPLLFAALVAAQTLITLAWPYLPTEDGSAHVATAVLLTRHDPAVWQYFRLDLFPAPNLGGHLLLALLVGLHVPPLLAEKLLVGGLLVGLPYALRATPLQIRPGAVALTYVALPLAINWFVYAGFYNFALGLVLLIASVGRWIRVGARRPAELVLWLLAAYLCHAATFVMTLVFFAVHLMWTHGVAARSWRARLAGLGADG